MARKEKLGDSRGVKDWQDLETIGDVKRFLRWTVLSLRSQSLDRADAAVFTQIANVVLRAVEGHDLEKRLRELEARYEQIAGETRSS